MLFLQLKFSVTVKEVQMYFRSAGVLPDFGVLPDYRLLPD